MSSPLPVDNQLDRIGDALRRHRAVVVTAAPGAGKTTRVPPALVADGPVILLQPRRVAARAVARRIAEERGWTLGREIGWHIRFERRYSAATRLLVATEGILTARLQHDPLLSEFTTVVLDEFHERSIHADLGLALARQAWLARPEMRIVVMSATLDTTRVASFLGECPVVRVAGRTYPLETEYMPEVPVEEAAARAHSRTSGQVLCFLPGAAEIRRTRPAVAARLPGVEVLELHGSLDGDQQDRVLRPSDTGRVILATNIAETALTVPGVTAVVDTGLQKLPRYDTSAGFDRLVLERVTRDSADQRAGRAGRLAPGLAIRLWDPRDRLRAHREPEIQRVDLAAPVLDVIAWGGDPETFEWFEAPPDHALGSALALLERLGALSDGRLTPRGRRLRELPLHPRLGAVLIAGGGAPAAALACAMLDAGIQRASDGVTTSSDVLSAMDGPQARMSAVRDSAAQIRRLADAWPEESRETTLSEAALRRALLAGYPDRVARRRQRGSPRLLLSSGTGAELSRDSGVHDAEWLVAIDITQPPAGGDARVRLASAVERDWLTPTRSSLEHTLGDDGRVRATRVQWYDALRLSESPEVADRAIATTLLADAWMTGPHDEAARRLLRRMRFAAIDVDIAELVQQAAAAVTRLQEIDVEATLPWAIRQRLERDAPSRLAVPSGRTVALEYREDGSVAASVRLQELFGVADTPLIGTRRQPALLLLLAPNGRPVQTTRDLRSFWERTYPEVRKQLRGRYPKHAWPEDPWAASPAKRK
jgi:ATP-dependent helicase HrpB